MQVHWCDIPTTWGLGVDLRLDIGSMLSGYFSLRRSGVLSSCLKFVPNLATHHCRQPIFVFFDKLPHCVRIWPHQRSKCPRHCLHDHLISVVNKKPTDAKCAARIAPATSGLCV